MIKYELSTSTIEKIKFYVYILIDPRNWEVFYVWKGKGNRINDHIKGFFIEQKQETEKNRKIEEIIMSWNKVKQIVIKHWLESESEAFNIESVIIDMLQLQWNRLTNIVKWHWSEENWIMDLEDIKIKYEAEEAIFDKDKIILININSLYKKNMSYEEIYEATRKSWVVDPLRANNATIICSVYRWIIREVFEINKSWEIDHKRCEQNPWLKPRYMFEWVLARDFIRYKYLNKSVKKYWIQWSQNPTKYVNI